MKKTIFSLVVLFCTMTSVNAQEVLNGDLDKSGTLTIGDVTTLVEMVMGKREPMYINTSSGMFEADNTTLYGTWETSDHESIVIFEETGAVYNNKKYSYHYYPNLQKLVLSDTESGLAKVMLFVNKESDAQISIFDNKIADFVLYDLSPEVVKVESITLSQTSLELTVDDTETIVATVLPEKAHQKVNWSSSDETVATVDENGVVTAVAIGTTTVICSATDGSEISETIQVTVIPNANLVTEITLSQTSLVLYVGRKETIEVTVTPEDADNKEVLWESSNEDIVTVKDGEVTAVTYGTATITCTATDGSGVKATCDVLVDHKYVDLGLTSGTLWATMNIGAEDPADIGDYFAWGETSPKSSYSWSNYAHCNGTSSTITKYCIDAGSGEPDGLTSLQDTDDAATQLWGDGWCMPTSAQLAELNDCRKTYTTRKYNEETVYGVEFYNRVTGTPALFLPLSGIVKNETATYDKGYYWSTKKSSSDDTKAGALIISINNSNQATMSVVYSSNRCYGIAIRPVRKGK